MIPHDIAVDPCSVFNIIARASLPLGWEQHEKPDAHMLPLARAKKLPLALSGAVRLYVRIANNLYRVQCITANRLPVSVLLGNEFNDH